MLIVFSYITTTTCTAYRVKGLIIVLLISTCKNILQKLFSQYCVFLLVAGLCWRVLRAHVAVLLISQSLEVAEKSTGGSRQSIIPQGDMQHYTAIAGPVRQPVEIYVCACVFEENRFISYMNAKSYWICMSLV